MNKSKIGKKIMVHGYKKNGWLYRVWEFPIIVDENDEYICVSKKNTTVVTSEKNSKRNFKSTSNKDCFWFFPKNKWYNIIVTINSDNSLSYYINIASPFIYEEEAIKYIDFDLDIKIYVNKEFKLLDENEFHLHKTEFNYGNKLIKIIENETSKLNNRKAINEIIQKYNVKLLLSLRNKFKNMSEK